MTAAAPRLVALPSGLTIALEEYGAPDGEPVFFFHGWPSGRAQGALLHAAAVEVGARILAVDRPGIGRSSPQKERRLTDWPPLLRELAAALNLERCRVIGVSGGGPYALVSAWGAPELVQSAAVICGAPPLADLGSAGLTFTYRMMLAIHARSRPLMRWIFRIFHPVAAVSPPTWMQVLLRGMVRGPDAVVLADATFSRLCYEGFRGAWGECRDGVFDDAEIYVRPWGFPLEEVHRPVQVWHGTEDKNFSYHLAEKVAERLPHCVLHLVPDEGHFSLPIRHASAILRELLAAPAGETLT
ncbi:MAG TPA: alpha/beta hydrolase [Chthoniobacteraceae bacterium]|jgi:pimeloyl-ACP methyl ester carboxylesterase